MPKLKSLENLYDHRALSRLPFLKRAVDASRLTLPHLIPENDHHSSKSFPTPYQSLGARGVNHLASKLLLTLLPPNSPFFRLKIDDLSLRELEAESVSQGLDHQQTKGDIEEGLSILERYIMSEIERSSTRVAIYEALRHLLVAGNVLLHVPKKGDLRVYHLSDYVITRSVSGDVLEIITKDHVTLDDLSDEIKQVCGLCSTDTRDETEDIALYSLLKRDQDKWVGYQELNGIRVPGSDCFYPKRKSPYIPLRYNRLDGESYGRGFVEEYLGDLQSLEGLMRAIVEGSAAMSKLLFLVRPGTSTKPKSIVEAPNCAVITGDSNDVSTLQAEKFADLRVAESTISRLESRLIQAFLMTSSIQRDAERVTAQEIRYMASELEDSLGGIYSILGQEFQLPFIERLIFQLTDKRKIPHLPREVQPQIITGLEALGRHHDLNRQDLFIKGLAGIFGPELLSQVLHIDEVVKRRAAFLGIDIKDLIKSQDEMKSDQQSAQLQQLVQQFGPKLIDLLNKDVHGKGPKNSS